MLIDDFEFIPLFKRELGHLKEELLAFRDEKDLWRVQGELKNSAGNLALHLNGNLNHYVGATIGKTGYVRERDKEFSEKNIPREELLRMTGETERMLADVIGKLSDEDLLRPYPTSSFGEGTKIAYVLVQLFGHFNYHLGQVNSLRRSMQA